MGTPSVESLIRRLARKSTSTSRTAFPELAGRRRLRLEFYEQFLLFTALQTKGRRSRRIRRIVVVNPRRSDDLRNIGVLPLLYTSNLLALAFLLPG
jgi:hypothetical protein